ncbi:hypothetical protein J8Z83_22825 [Yersinia enterocolitica]|uniref:hypothetical protein n=2 Tax=Yersinia enterocolitica TaxID=630 RepID=UPI001CA51C22|nr:hypothetical protein [Yersinia enterocolitica]MBW5868632.1 hypothetical protein [Yersinia enterocolitica]MBX9477443.1 hypothetical protein [Yersinia enterocolitica]
MQIDIFLNLDAGNIFILEGNFSGDYIPGDLLSPKSIENLPLLINFESYDHGTVVLDILRPSPDKTTVELAETIKITQNELIFLLQTGCYWEKGKGEVPRKVDLFSNGC